MLYSRVDEFLAGEVDTNDIPDIIVSFCIVVERLLKIKLYERNPLLVFEDKVITNSSIAIIALGRKTEHHTAQIKIILGRYGIIFEKVFTEDEFQAIGDIFDLRNDFIHGYADDSSVNYDPDSIVIKIGTVWTKVSEIAVSIFGKKFIKMSNRKKKYTEKQLEKVLEEEVRKMIQSLPSLARRNEQIAVLMNSSPNLEIDEKLFAAPYHVDLHSADVFRGLTGGDEVCPRCHSRSFVLTKDETNWSFYNSLYAAVPQVLINENLSNLYKCRQCHLELTPKYYAIAKRISNSH